MSSVVKPSSKKRIAFETLGCRSNFADTVELEAKLVELGASPCSFESGYEDGADVYVLNTCTVTDNADKTVYRILKKVRAASPEAKIVVTGCMAEVKAKEIKDSGLGDVVLGPGQKAAVIEAVLSGVQGEDKRQVEMPVAYDNGRRAKKSAASFRSISLDSEFPACLLYTSPSPRDATLSRMPSSA